MRGHRLPDPSLSERSPLKDGGGAGVPLMDERTPTGTTDAEGNPVFEGDTLEDERGNLCDVIRLDDGTFALRPRGTNMTWRMATDRMTKVND